MNWITYRSSFNLLSPRSFWTLLPWSGVHRGCRIGTRTCLTVDKLTAAWLCIRYSRWFLPFLCKITIPQQNINPTIQSLISTLIHDTIWKIWHTPDRNNCIIQASPAEMGCQISQFFGYQNVKPNVYLTVSGTLVDWRYVICHLISCPILLAAL